MKKLILFLSLILSVGFASAQSEIPSDSIRRAKDSLILFLRLLSPAFLALATDMVGDCLLLHSLCRWDLSN